MTWFNSLWPKDTIWRQHQAITWTNVDWSSVKSSDIHIRAISQETPQPSITKIFLKITYQKFHSTFPGANELKVRYLTINPSNGHQGNIMPYLQWMKLPAMTKSLTKMDVCIFHYYFKSLTAFPTSSSQNQVELSEWATGHFMQQPEPGF